MQLMTAGVAAIEAAIEPLYLSLARPQSNAKVTKLDRSGTVSTVCDHVTGFQI